MEQLNDDQINTPVGTNADDHGKLCDRASPIILRKGFRLAWSLADESLSPDPSLPVMKS